MQDLIARLEYLMLASEVLCTLKNPVLSDSGNLMFDMSILGKTDFLLIIDYAKKMVSTVAGKIDVTRAVTIPNGQARGVFYNHNYYRDQKIKQIAEEIALKLLA